MKFQKHRPEKQYFIRQNPFYKMIFNLEKHATGLRIKG